MFPSVITPFAYKVLEIIPTSVLLGVFYYLAYASLKGVQLSARTKLLITPVKHHPKVPYVTKVTTSRRVHRSNKVNMPIFDVFYWYSEILCACDYCPHPLATPPRFVP